MRYENWIRRLETRVGSVVGVNGGIDAVRRPLYLPMRADHLPDFVLPLRVVEQGQRVVFCPDAVSHEEALQRPEDEFRMRVRVSLRALHALFDMRRLLSPRYGLFAFQLLVHKVLRYLVFAFLAGALIANAFVLEEPEYRITLALQLAFYGWALVGILLPGSEKIRGLALPFLFLSTNVAWAVAFFKFLRGDRQVTWVPRKGG